MQTAPSPVLHELHPHRRVTIEKLKDRRVFPLDPAIDTRLVLRIYAAVVGVFGFVLAFWGPIWLEVNLPGQPFGRAAFIRVFGAITMAAACWAAGLATIREPFARHRALRWFTAAHFVVWLTVLSQRITIWEAGPADLALWLILAAAFLLMEADYEYMTASAVWLFARIFHGAPSRSLSPYSSHYDRQLREAAGQEERHRLARDLHDSIKQQIFVMHTAAATVDARFDADPDGARQAIAQIRSAAREAMTEMEVMLDQLRAEPLENAGLVAALKRQCEALGFRTGASVEFTLGTLPPTGALAAGAHRALFRVAQEALANVGRHSRASIITVSLASGEGRVELLIQDNGVGFDPATGSRGMGTENMRARAAEHGGMLALESQPGQGTRVRLWIPYVNESPSRHRRNACVWAGILIVMSLLAYRDRHRMIDLSAIGPAVAAVALARSVILYRRARRAGAAR